MLRFQCIRWRAVWLALNYLANVPGVGEDIPPYTVSEKLLAARELLRRALAETFSRIYSATGWTRGAVRDYLRLFLGGQSVRELRRSLA
jgi:hypothetical protein